MEEFRPVVVDSAVITAINTGMVSCEATSSDRKAGCVLKDTGRKAFIRAYEARLDQLATHPVFDYRCSWRSLIRLQARLLARWLRGDVPTLPGDHGAVGATMARRPLPCQPTTFPTTNAATRVFKTLHGFGDHAQYSVFFCELSDQELVQLRTKLRTAIHHKEDQVLIVDLGTNARPLDEGMEVLGRGYQPATRVVVV